MSAPSEAPAPQPASTPPITRSRGYLGGTFVVLHQAPGTPVRVGVLILPPLGYEDTSAYRPLRTLADAVAAAGHLALRLDWPGLGDSAGADLDDDLHVRPLEAVQTGAAAVRAAGCTSVIAVGVRAGGLYALAAAGLDELVLWAVPASGKRYVREERAFQGFAEAAFGGVSGPAPPAGAVEAGGFLYGPRVVEGLTAMDPTRAPPNGVRRALLIGRDGAAPDEALVTALRGAGTQVDEMRGEGLGVLLENA